jgi:hypothetical protein
MTIRFLAAAVTLVLAATTPVQRQAIAAPACFYQTCYDNCLARGGPKSASWRGSSVTRPWAACARACQRCRTV